MRRFLVSLLEILEVVLIALGAVFFIRTYLVQPFLVSGASMVPNFSHGDYLLIDELSYRFREPVRGEVMVFRYPANRSTFFIKRLIGLPGDRIVLEGEMIKIFNPLYTEGLTLEEPYLAPETKTSARPGGRVEFSLGAGEYLVLGDNRTYSLDSRDWGVLKREDIVGLVRLRLWPLSGLTVFASPSYSQ